MKIKSRNMRACGWVSDDAHSQQPTLSFTPTLQINVNEVKQTPKPNIVPELNIDVVSINVRIFFANCA
jgi:hypothetical protein